MDAADYSSTQRQLLEKCLFKAKEWREMRDDTDWKHYHEEKKITIFTKDTPRKLNAMKSIGEFPFTPMQVWRCLMDGRYRTQYDQNIDKTQMLEKWAANSYFCYQRSKAMFMVSSRDFIIC